MTTQERMNQLDNALSLLRKVAALADLDRVDADRLFTARQSIAAVIADLTDDDTEGSK